MARGTLTVGCGAGFAGDRIEPAVEMAGSGQVDFVGLECLAERTLVTGLIERAANPRAGYDRRIERRLGPLIPVALANGCGIVSNLGSANPFAAAERIVELCRREGLSGFRVAAVLGDDLGQRSDAVEWEGDPLAGGGQWLGSHAYLGTTEIAEAFRGGASIVVTGRVADSALFAAPAIAGAELEQGLLAGALTAGHLLECGGQLTGGNLAASRGTQLAAHEFADLGYPVATIDGDGSFVLGVLPGKPARLDAVSATLQLLYEVHDPRQYHTPDLTLDFGELRFEEIGENRVRVTGASGAGRPATLKAVGFVRRPGEVADVEITYAGQGALGRAEVAAETLRRRMEMLGFADFAVDLVGVDSVLGRVGDVPVGYSPPEVRVHISSRCATGEEAQVVEDEVYALTLSGPAGGCSLRSERRPNVSVVSGRVSRDAVHVSVEYLVS